MVKTRDGSLSHRQVKLVVGDAPKDRTDWFLCEGSETQQGFHVVADSSLDVAVVLDRTAHQHAGLVEHGGAWKQMSS